MPSRGVFAIPWKGIWRYRDLLFMFVKRDIVTIYKQTVLGPLWFFIQPILTVAMYVIVFNRIAKLSTDGLPPILFYLSGIIIWNFFQESFNTTAKTFIENAKLFGKVYFPRIILPLSKIISGFVRFLIQFFLFAVVYIYFIANGYQIQINQYIVFLPVMIAIMGFLGLGLGILFTSLTTKYRDLVFLIQFGIQLLMYATPVIYPLSKVPETYHAWFYLNPMTSVLEGFRFVFLGTGTFTVESLMVSLVSSIVIFMIGLVVFNTVEKNFMDTV
jgi:lipopolysaccharide transport system permease protein